MKWLLVLLCGVSGLAAAAEPQILGLYEQILLLPQPLLLEAKIDTGADSSSLNAQEMETYKKAGQRRVRFTISGLNKQHEIITVNYDQEIIKTIIVKGAGGKDKRPVVALDICIGGKQYHELFTLRDRGNMQYPVLLGQKTLRQLGLIDVNQKYLLPARCTTD